MKKRIYELLRAVPRGKVVTYGEIAAYLGNKWLARYVGNVLHENPDGELYPCYKVVNKNGLLSESYAFGGAEKQKEKLEKDGITVIKDEKGKYKVDIKKYGFDIQNIIKQGDIV